MISYLVRPGRIKELAGLAESWPAVVYDCETTGLDMYLGDRLLGFAIGNLRQGEGEPAYYYIPLTHNHPDDDPAYNATIQDLEPLRPIMEGKPLVGYNVKFDLHCQAETFEFGGSPIFDVLPFTRIMSHEDRPLLDLESVAAQELGYQYTSVAAGHQSQYGKNVFTAHEIGNKCCEDVFCTGQLYCHWVDGDTPESLLTLFKREARLTRILYGMERRGILYDPKALKHLDKLLTGKAEELLARIRKEMKLPELNPRSSPQVEALMEQLGINPLDYNPPKKDGTVSPKWAREQLLEVDHPVALGIAQHRALTYQMSNLIKHLKRHVEHLQKVMRFNYQNWGTTTGRLSASAPNVQGMAKGWLQLGQAGEGGEALMWSEDGPDKTIAVRSLFVPRPGYFFLEADYSQIEMFIAGWYMAQVGDSTLLDLCRSEDVHAATARLVWGGETPEFRKRAKWFNFGLLYGLGDEGMAKKLKCSKAQAVKYRGDYFRKIGPGYFTCLRDIKWRLRNNGYEENVFGRRYYASEDIAYMIWNYKVQGSAGDFVKFRQEAIEMLCQELDIHPIFTTHDDILLEVPNALMDSHHLRRLIDILEDGSEPFGMRFPLKTKIARTNLAEMEAYLVPSAV